MEENRGLKKAVILQHREAGCGGECGARKCSAPAVARHPACPYAPEAQPKTQDAANRQRTFMEWRQEFLRGLRNAQHRHMERIKFGAAVVLLAMTLGCAVDPATERWNVEQTQNSGCWTLESVTHDGPVWSFWLTSSLAEDVPVELRIFSKLGTIPGCAPFEPVVVRAVIRAMGKTGIQATLPEVHGDFSFEIVAVSVDR